jgi:glycosyltransferase involved in cell wall biosynthesis
MTHKGARAKQANLNERKVVFDDGSMQVNDIFMMPEARNGKNGWPWETGLSPPAPSLTYLPGFSIIVPSLNQGRFIEECIRSVLLQNYPNVELIVIDGGSSDETVNILRRYDAFLAYWVTESDRGQADAINKGFLRSTGEIRAYLNSDDLYLPGALWKVAKSFTENDVSIVRCGVRLVENDLAHLHWDHIPCPKQLRTLRTHNPVFQPGVFWKTHLHNQVGEFRLDLHYSMDWEFFIRLFDQGRHKDEDFSAAVYRFHADHKTGSGGRKRFAELLRLVDEVAPLEFAQAAHLVSGPKVNLWWYQGEHARWLRRFPAGTWVVNIRNRFYNSKQVYTAWLLIEEQCNMSRAC